MINLALVGCGGMAHAHANNLKKIPECAVTALVDIRPERPKQFKEKYFAEAATYDSYEDFVAKPPKKLDGVILVTPHTLHYGQAKTALKKGWHVLCEKPMVTSSEHAYDLWKTVKKSGKILDIAFQSAHSAEFGAIAAMRDAGKIGKIQIITAYMCQMWLPGTRGSWRQDPAQSGGGQMYDSGAHTLNAMMWLMNNPVVEVSCFYDKCGSPVDINGVAILKYQNGAIGSVSIGGNCPHWSQEVKIQTDTMHIITETHGVKLEMWGANGRKVYPQVTMDEHASAWSPQLNFVRAILGQEKPKAPVRFGVLLSALMDALYEAADSGKVVKVKPVPEEI